MGVEQVVRQAIQGVHVQEGPRRVSSDLTVLLVPQAMDSFRRSSFFQGLHELDDRLLPLALDDVVYVGVLEGLFG